MDTKVKVLVVTVIIAIALAIFIQLKYFPETKEQMCIRSGGKVSTGLCCRSVGNALNRRVQTLQFTTI